MLFAQIISRLVPSESQISRQNIKSEEPLCSHCLKVAQRPPSVIFNVMIFLISSLHLSLSEMLFLICISCSLLSHSGAARTLSVCFPWWLKNVWLLGLRTSGLDRNDFPLKIQPYTSD